MKEIEIPVQVSGLDIIKITLGNLKDNLEFTDDTSEDYRKGFTDCLNGMIAAFKVTEDLKNSQK